MKYKKPELSN